MKNLHLTFVHVVPVKSKVKISQNYVTFSEYMNINKILSNYHEYKMFCKSDPDSNLVKSKHISRLLDRTNIFRNYKSILSMKMYLKYSLKCGFCKKLLLYESIFDQLSCPFFFILSSFFSGCNRKATANPPKCDDKKSGQLVRVAFVKK